MDPYAKPNERKVGAQRPKISHLRSKINSRTRKQRQVEKQAVSGEAACDHEISATAFAKAIVT